MIARHPISDPICEGSWVGIRPSDNSGEIYDCGLLDEQIVRLRQGDFVAVEERTNTWLCWDIKGCGGKFRVPKHLLTEFSPPKLTSSKQLSAERNALRLFGQG